MMEDRHPGPTEPPPAARTARLTEPTLLTEDDLFLFNEGSHSRLFEKLGAHPLRHGDREGTLFAVWAPSAERVTVIGDFDDWDTQANPLRPLGSSGIWQGFLPDVGHGDRYKFHIVGPSGYEVDKADPFAFFGEVPPDTASVVWDLDHGWSDGKWMRERQDRNWQEAPISTYEVHLGSWMRDEKGMSLSYRDLAPRLADHVARTGFTHVELLPVMEHPFFGSWGYQTTGYFAPTSRYGTPQDFMWLVDHLHQRGIGVILDWVPSHFPNDEHGLGFFDGTHLYEHADPRKGFHPDWNSLIFNYGRNEVRSFLLSSAVHWLSTYHADGLRVDAVASMLYLDYSRAEGQWIPNEHGGRENLEAVAFLRRLNEEVERAHPDVQTIAEESTAWPMVSRPTHLGGLGFDMKWDMGWMHDTLQYLALDPVYRRFHHTKLTFRQLYAHTESFVLPLSHDEVVHGKGSLIGKMAGDDWQRFAHLRLLLGYQFAQPGKKLLFMGGEFGQWREWNHDAALDWHLLEDPRHEGVQRWVEDLNRLYREEPAMHELDADPAGFEWIDPNDAEASVVSFLRKARSVDDLLLVVCNFTPVPRPNYLVGVPQGGHWREVLNGDAELYGGSGQGNVGGVEAVPVPAHGRPRAINLMLPPLGCLFLKSEGLPP
jgi:1,4-alpha-glucan branching enzyme